MGFKYVAGKIVHGIKHCWSGLESPSDNTANASDDIDNDNDDNIDIIRPISVMAKSISIP